MAGQDGNVEVRITGSIDPSVAASAGQARAELAGLASTANVSASAMAAALKQAGGDLSKITPEMLGLAAATEAESAAVIQETAAVTTNTAAVAANTTAQVSNRAAYETLVLVHEALSQRYTRMAGSALILTQALAGNTASASFLTAALNPLVIGLVAATAALAYFTYQEYQHEKAAAAAAEAFALTGRGAENSAAGVQKEVDQLNALPGVSRKGAEALVDFDARHADVNARLAEAANQLIPQFVKAFGKDGPEALNKMKEGLAAVEHDATEPAIRKFEEMNRSFLNLRPAEAQVIEGMIASGDAIGAVNRALDDLAKNGGGNIVSVNAEVAKVEAQLQQAKAALDVYEQASKHAFNSGDAQAYALAIGEAAKQVERLTGRLAQLKAVQAQPAQGEDPADAYAKSHATLLSLRDSATRAKDAVKELHDEMNIRIKANPKDAEALDYFANQAKVDADLEKKIDPGEFKKPRGQETQITAWRDELLQSEYDMRSSTGQWLADMSDFEVQFWQSKVATAKAGSQTYGEAQKALETAMLASQRQVAEQTLATDKEQIEAKKRDWGDEKTALEKYLADAAKLYGQQAPQYKAVQKEVEAAEREHDAVLGEIARAANHEQLSELRSNLDTEKTLRQQNANSAIALIEQQAKYSGDPLAEIRALQQVAQIHQSTLQQEMADEVAYQARRDALLQDDIDIAIERYGKDSREHQKALDEKALADVQYANKYALLQGQMATTAQQDALKVETAWHNTMAQLGQSVSSGLSGMAKGTETVVQALANVGDTIIDKVVDSLVKWGEEEAVAYAMNHAHTAADVATHAAAESAKTAATTIGVAERTAAETAGVAQSSAFLGRFNEKQITADAAKAAAGAYSATAGIPIVGPILAPIAAATAFAGVMAFENLASFDKGTNYVPADMVAQIHEGERVIPKADNAALMAAVAGGGGPQGDNWHIHYSPTIHERERTGLPQMLANDGHHLLDFLTRAVRDGALKLQPA